MENSQIQKQYQNFLKYLDDNELKYSASDDGDQIIYLGFESDDFPLKHFFEFRTNKPILIVQSPMPYKADSKIVRDISLAINIVNQTLQCGQFRLDVTTGEIDFRYAYYYGDLNLTPEVFDYIIGLTNYATNEFNDKLFLVIKGALSLEELHKMANE